MSDITIRTVDPGNLFVEAHFTVTVTATFEAYIIPSPVPSPPTLTAWSLYICQDPLNPEAGVLVNASNTYTLPWMPGNPSVAVIYSATDKNNKWNRKLSITGSAFNQLTYDCILLPSKTQLIQQGWNIDTSKRIVYDGINYTWEGNTATGPVVLGYKIVSMDEGETWSVEDIFIFDLTL